MLTIDGTYGEGGGQILRTALTLALATGTAFHMVHIRARRPKPGLLRQHLTAVQAAARIGCATVHGATPGSPELTFIPNQVTPGTYTFDVGSAGSTTLVLQTVLPVLLCASGASHLTLIGGTHNPFAPSFDFLTQAFLPLLQRMGARVTAQLERPGFYPAGGGQCQVTITPVPQLTRLDLPTRGAIQAQRARAVVANLPPGIATRELAVIGRQMGWPTAWLHAETADNARGPGNVVSIEIVCERVTEVFTGFGARGVTAETVAQRTVQAAQRYLAADVAVGEYLADQLLVPMALAGGGMFTTLPLSQHATTNIHVIQQFLDLTIAAVPIGHAVWQVSVTPLTIPHNGHNV